MNASNVADSASDLTPEVCADDPQKHEPATFTSWSALRDHFCDLKLRAPAKETRQALAQRANTEHWHLYIAAARLAMELQLSAVKTSEELSAFGIDGKKLQSIMDLQLKSPQANMRTPPQQFQVGRCGCGFFTEPQCIDLTEHIDHCARGNRIRQKPDIKQRMCRLALYNAQKHS